MGRLQTVGQACLIDRKAVVLARDHHPPGPQVLHRVIGPVVPELHLDGTRPARQPQQLVSQTDAEERDAGLQQGTDGVDRIVTGLRITGTVGEEDAIRSVGQHRVRRSTGRNHRYPATARDQHPQDVAFDAEVVGDDVVGLFALMIVVAMRQAPHPLGPDIGIGGAGVLGQVHSLEPRKGTRRGQCRGLVDPLPRHQTATLGPLLAQDAGQPAGIDPGDANHPLAEQVGIQPLAHPEVARQQRQVSDDEPGRLDGRGLLVLRVHTDIANVRIGQGDQLAQVGRIGQDLLITAHGGIENDFANARTIGADRDTPEDGTVFQDQNCGLFQGILRTGMRHGRYRGGRVGPPQRRACQIRTKWHRIRRDSKGTAPGCPRAGVDTSISVHQAGGGTISRQFPGSRKGPPPRGLRLTSSKPE